MTERFVCDLSALEDPGSYGVAGETPVESGYFIVRKGGKVYGYRNSCPHTGAPLEWQPHRFLDHTGELIQCALHGALFEIESGRCLRGPCAGEHLEPVKVRLEDNRVKLLTG